MVYVQHTSAFSDFSLPQLRELLSDGPDAKLIMILTRVLTFYILILRTARNMPTTVCMSLLSRIELTVISQRILIVFANMFSNSMLPQLVALVTSTSSIGKDNRFFSMHLRVLSIIPKVLF